MRNRKNQNEFFSQNARKSIFGSKQKLKTKTILLAVSGDTEALMEVVDTYKPYIEKLSMRVVMDENGHCREMVDETVKRSLEVGLIAAIMKFHPYIWKSADTIKKFVSFSNIVPWKLNHQIPELGIWKPERESRRERLRHDHSNIRARNICSFILLMAKIGLRWPFIYPSHRQEV